MDSPRIITKKDLNAEIETLGFSQTKGGPDCNSCFNLVLETVCGHGYIVRERCNPKSLVCVGSKPRTIDWDDVTLALGEAECQSCRKIHKYHENHSESLTKLYAQKFTPKRMAAKLRMEAIKEKWQRECVEQDLLVAGLTRGQLDALAAEKATEKEKAPKASPSSSEDSDSSDWVLPHVCDFVGEDPNLEKERGKCLLQKVLVGSVSRAENDAEAPQSPIDDPRPAFVFRSPYLSQAPTDKNHVQSEK